MRRAPTLMPAATLLIDIALLISVTEGVLLFVHHRCTGHGLPFSDYGTNLLSGLCLMLALRSVATDASDLGVMLLLLASGIAHWCEIIHRWNRARAPQGRLEDAPAR